MNKILIFSEYSNGKVKRSTLELLGAAGKTGLPVAAVAFGSDAASIAADLSSYGAKEVHLFKDASVDLYNPELFSSLLGDLVKSIGADVILASSSSTGRDLFPRVAAMLNASIASDCTGLNFVDGTVKVKKPLNSGKCLASLALNNQIKIVLMRPNQLPVAEPSGNTVAPIEHAVPAMNLATMIKSVVKGASEKLDLTEANIIVSGGRGLKEAGNFKLLEDLASVLGATVGASRAVVDAGWVSHGMQVGQTGKTVAPSLYIAVGISGAIQHLAGMSGSKVVVAINNDPNAPIFQKSTFGIVGDLFEVLPKLTEEFKKALQ